MNRSPKQTVSGFLSIDSGPRGVKREQAAVDQWSKELAPTHELRKWFSHIPERFPEFSRLYREELESRREAAAAAISAARGHSQVTLLYAAKNTSSNHAVVLKQWLEERVVE